MTLKGMEGEEKGGDQGLYSNSRKFSWSFIPQFPGFSGQIIIFLVFYSENRSSLM